MTDLRLFLAWVFVTIPAACAGYVTEAAVRAFRRGRRMLDEDVRNM